MSRLIYHVDVNSAFLSWTAARRVLLEGESADLRTVPAIIGGDASRRHGIVLAKSIPARKYGIVTGEPVAEAVRKCPSLVVAPPEFELYESCSRAFMALLRTVSPVVEPYSVDEAFADMTAVPEAVRDPEGFARRLKDRIHAELGFTVNIGVSENKLLAKIAGDFTKPDRVHTLFPGEVEEKLWPLPVRVLMFVGPSTERMLWHLGIRTVGELARTDADTLRSFFGKQGDYLWRCSRGISTEAVSDAPFRNKGYSHAATLPRDITDRDSARRVLLSLAETLSSRLRADGQAASLLCVSLRSRDFVDISRQRTMETYTDITEDIWRGACGLFDELWDGVTPLRQLGIRLSRLGDPVCRQYSLFDPAPPERRAQLDSAVDAIRAKYGGEAIRRASLVL